MAYNRYDTYDRRVQLKASRHRYRDAKFLQQSGRWNGAVYLAGYAIECSLKSLICYFAHTNNFKATSAFRSMKQRRTSLHDLVTLFETSGIERFIQNSHNDTLQTACNTVTKLWRKDELRYGQYLGDEAECRDFLEAVEMLHIFILHQQDEAS